MNGHECERVTRQLLDEDARLWTGLLRAHSCLTQRLDRDLRAAHAIGLTELELLLSLDLNGGRQRMHELAAPTMLSAAGVTRLVDRLVAAKLVEREPVENDARGSFAVLTEAGEQALDAALATHAAGVREQVVAPLSAPQRVAATEVFETWAPVALDQARRSERQQTEPPALVNSPTSIERAS